MSIPQAAVEYGFVIDGLGAHSSRTIMLKELRLLSAACPSTTDMDGYRSAILDSNVLLKQTEASRQTLTRPIGRDAIRHLVHAHTQDITTFQQRKAFYLKTGYALIEERQETQLLRTVKGAGVSNTLALVSEIGNVQRFPSGEQLAASWA